MHDQFHNSNPGARAPAVSWVFSHTHTCSAPRCPDDDASPRPPRRAAYLGLALSPNAQQRVQSAPVVAIVLDTNAHVDPHGAARFVQAVIGDGLARTFGTDAGATTTGGASPGRSADRERKPAHLRSHWSIKYSCSYCPGIHFGGTDLPAAFVEMEFRREHEALLTPQEKQRACFCVSMWGGIVAHSLGVWTRRFTWCCGSGAGRVHRCAGRSFLRAVSAGQWQPRSSPQGPADGGCVGTRRC